MIDESAVGIIEEDFTTVHHNQANAFRHLGRCKQTSLSLSLLCAQPWLASVTRAKFLPFDSG